MKRIAPLMRFIPMLSPRYGEPTHLAPLVARLEAVLHGEQQAAVHCPPRHAKTDTISHGVAWLLKQRPSMRIAYVTYAQRLAEKKSRRMRELAERARVPLDKDAASKGDWRTGVDEGGVWATSIGGPITGEGFDLAIIDDPVKDRVMAESALARDRVHEWFTDVLYGRLEPRASVIVCMHRWHVDDLSGRLIRDGWDEVCLPAIGADGRALWPERYSLEVLEKRRERVGDYAWSSLYQGQPMARGGAVFRDVQTYDALPDGLELAIGVDFAYSTRTHADYSVAVLLGAKDERYFVLDVLRVQKTAPQFQAELNELHARHAGAELVAYVSGTEKGAVDMMASQGLPIVTRPAVADKFTRSQPVAAAWNAGRVLVPAKDAPWRDRFVSELAGFTGIGDRHDDQVDALAAAFDRLHVVTQDDGETLIGPGPGRSADGTKDPWLRNVIRSRYAR